MCASAVLERMLRRTRLAVTSGELIDLFVADGLSAGDRFPFAGLVVPDFDRVFLNMLPVVQPLHGQRVVERYRAWRN